MKHETFGAEFLAEAADGVTGGTRQTPPGEYEAAIYRWYAMIDLGLI